MSDYLHFDISFPDIDFDKYLSSSEKCDNFHKAHLYESENEIEIKIFYRSKTDFGRKFMHWFMNLNNREFGTKIKIKNENINQRIYKLDFTNSALVSTSYSTKLNNEGLETLSIFIDCVKFYYHPSPEDLNTAEFYINDAGFSFVQYYYAQLFEIDNSFKYRRMKGYEKFYSIGKSKFRPEFNFIVNDDRKNKDSIITKEPKLQFKYYKEIDEEKAILYGDVLSLLVSFYFHVKVHFIYTRIHLKDYTVVIKKIQSKNSVKQSGGFFGMNIEMNFDMLLKSKWQRGTFHNFTKLSRIIELFNQSHALDDYSKFLIRFNIIEYCKPNKSEDNKYEQILKGQQLKNKYKEALHVLLKTLNPEDHKQFSDKWNSTVNDFFSKSINHSLNDFLKSQNIDSSKFPLTIQKIVKLRNDIVHGSIDDKDLKHLPEVNRLLYRINGILILNLIFGSVNWRK